MTKTNRYTPDFLLDIFLFFYEIRNMDVNHLLTFEKSFKTFKVRSGLKNHNFNQMQSVALNDR